MIYQIIGVIIVMGFIINLITYKKRQDEKVNELKKQIATLEEMVADIEEQTDKICNLSASKIDEIQKNNIDISGYANTIITSSKLLQSSFDNVVQKIHILAKLSADDSVTETNKLTLISEYIQALDKDISINQEIQKNRQRLELERGFGYGI